MVHEQAEPVGQGLARVTPVQQLLAGLPELLQLCGIDRHDQLGAAGEVPIEGRVGERRALGDLVERHVDAALVEQSPGRRDERRAVACGIDAASSSPGVAIVGRIAFLGTSPLF